MWVGKQILMGAIATPCPTQQFLSPCPPQTRPWLEVICEFCKTKREPSTSALQNYITNNTSQFDFIMACIFKRFIQYSKHGLIMVLDDIHFVQKRQENFVFVQFYAAFLLLSCLACSPNCQRHGRVQYCYIYNVMLLQRE